MGQAHPKDRRSSRSGLSRGKYEAALQRNVTERQGLETIERFVPGSTPTVYWSDEKRFFFIMEDLKASTPLKQLLDDGSAVPAAFRNIARFMSSLHKASHVTAISDDEFKHLIETFDTVLGEEAVEWMFDESFSSSGSNARVRRDTEELRPVLPQIVDDADIAAVNQRLRRSYLRDKRCFIHGDSHPGFAMIDGGNNVKVIDTEFANISNPAKEVGYFLGEIVIWYYVNQGRGKQEVSEDIKQCTEILLTEYIKEMAGYLTDQEDFMHYVAGHAGHFNAIRTINLMPYPPFDDLQVAEAQCVSAAVKLMKGMMHVNTIDQFMTAAFG